MVARRRCGGDGWRWNGGWVAFGYVGEKREGGGAVRREGENEGKGKKGELKGSCEELKNTCDQMYVHAFERMRVECVCVIGRYARTNASEFERRPVSVIERTYVHSNACVQIVCVYDRALCSNKRK
jgi:hypothetical protein